MTNTKTICTVCNYIYDEELGEPRQEIAPLIKFDALPEKWLCPECGSDKDMFLPCSCVSLHRYELTCVDRRESDIESGARRNQSERTNLKRTPVGQLVAQRPSRACLFEELAIDYCCGGKISLEEACRSKNLDVEEVVARLAAIDSKEIQFAETDWNKADLADLVDHIISTYHQPLKKELSRIEQLAQKVARVHGENHPEMTQVLDIFSRFKAQLELHMQKEEMVLFPGIKAMETTGTPQIFGCGGGIEHPIDVMTQEHDDAGETLKELRRLTEGYAPPADACGTFKVLLWSLAQLESQMHEHVHLENNILFPRALAFRNLEAASTK